MANRTVVERSCAKLRLAIKDEANFTVDLQEILEELETIHGLELHRVGFMDSDLSSGLVTKVREAAYGISDMVDELQATRAPAAGKMTKMLACSAAVNVPNNKEMSDKMKDIKKKLKGLHKLSLIMCNLQDTRAPGIVGRDQDIENIIACLSACDTTKGPAIILIDGKKGLGKTTLAAMVFDDTRFRCYSRVWVNVSYKLDLHRIGESIISQVSGEEEISHGSNGDMESITKRLRELLSGMKVLIVLDDLWENLSQWKTLKSMLTVRENEKGSQVILIATVCICPDEVLEGEANKIFTVQLYKLNPLNDDMCSTIIKQTARSKGRSAKEDSERIAQEIAKLCKGFPLAAQLFGRLLQFKDYKDWPALLDRSQWERYSSPLDLSMELSYLSMPLDLRVCFSYCAIFLVGCTIVKEDLIHQWISLNLIGPSDASSTRQQLAEQYIRRLLDMSLLQTTKLYRTSRNDDKGAILLTVHEGVHAYATLAIQVELGILDGTSTGSWLRDEHWRYALLVDFDARPLESIMPDQKIRSLRCLGCSKMVLSHDSFSFAKCLRVLELRDESSKENLPDSICQLKYLGYLNLSGWSRLKTLPESFGDLTNLLHIDLSRCFGLENLPGSFGKLINLVHINLSGCSALVNLPEFFGKLINLVYINLSGCSGLVNLPEFLGKLINLVHINLSGCSGLVNLPGSFGNLIKVVHIDLSKCSRLQKLPKSFGKLISVEHINLSGCSGLGSLPESFGKLVSLVHIDLSGCSRLENLPGSFGKLINLLHINLSGCSALVNLPESFGDLTNLVHINLSRCHGLPKLPESFGNLRKVVYLDLSFWSCFEGIQTALGGLTKLQHLNLSHPCCYRGDSTHLKGLKEVLGQFTRLKHLNLSMLLNPIFYNESEEENRKYIEFIRGFPILEHLDLSHNIFLRDLPRLDGLHRLHTLDLSGCVRLKKVERLMAEMKSLKSIVVSNCPGLESYQFVVRVSDSINNYVNLEDVSAPELEISCLEKMKSVVEARRIRLVEKEKLRTLKLRWNKVDTDPDLGDEALLGELVPPHSLQCLVLDGYRGKFCCPSRWWTPVSCSSNLLNLEEITMDNIPSCQSLPPLLMLPKLQRVVLKRMASITRIHLIDLSFGNTAACSRLSQLTIEDMGSLEEFNTIYDSDGDEGLLFPAIGELIVKNCPKLSFVPVPPRARRFVVSGCNCVMNPLRNRRDVELFSWIYPSVTELVVDNCGEHLNDWAVLNQLHELRSLTIKNCCNLTKSSEIIEALSSLQTVCFSHCNGMTELPEYLGDLTSLRELKMMSCGQLKSLPDSMRRLTSLQSIHFSDCQSMRQFPDWFCDLASRNKLANLTDLRIWDCPDLKSWCESESKRKSLGDIRPTYEEASASKSTTTIWPEDIELGPSSGLITRRETGSRVDFPIGPSNFGFYLGPHDAPPAAADDLASTGSARAAYERSAAADDVASTGSARAPSTSSVRSAAADDPASRGSRRPASHTSGRSADDDDIASTGSRRPASHTSGRSAAADDDIASTGCARTLSSPSVRSASDDDLASTASPRSSPTSIHSAANDDLAYTASRRTSSAPFYMISPPWLHSSTLEGVLWDIIDYIFCIEQSSEQPRD